MIGTAEYVDVKPLKKRKLLNELTAEELVSLKRLNARLAKLELKILKEARAILNDLNSRIKDPNDWIQDYELECKIYFYIKKTDKAFRRNEDNIITCLEEGLKKYKDHSWGLGDGEDHNDRAEQEVRDYHCWIMHSLYDHTYPKHLGFLDLLRIGKIEVNIEVRYQNSIELSPDMSIKK